MWGRALAVFAAVALALALSVTPLQPDRLPTRHVVATIPVMATAYNANDGHEWRDGSVVYAGGPPWEGTVAISRDLHRSIPMGARVRIRGYEYIVRDLMGPTIHGARIDIYHSSLARARRFGIQPLDMEILSKEHTQHG